MVRKNSIPGGFAYIWQSKWVGIIAIKTERTQIHFLSDVLIAVASLNLKVLNMFCKKAALLHKKAEFLHKKAAFLQIYFCKKQIFYPYLVLKKQDFYIKEQLFHKNTIL